MVLVVLLMLLLVHCFFVVQNGNQNFCVRVELFMWFLLLVLLRILMYDIIDVDQTFFET